jgi:hypothetical protein
MLLSRLTLAAALLAALAGCPKNEPSSLEDPEPVKKADTSNVIKIETTVPYGKQVPCTQILDAARLTEELGEADPVVILDTKEGDREATAVCSVRRGGKALTEAEQKKRLQKNDLELGAMAGDEICQLRAYCSFSYDVAEEKKRLEGLKQSCVEGEIGDLTCIHRVPIGPRDRIIVTVLDPESKCRYTVSPTTLIDEEPMKKCARAFVTLISKEQWQGKTPPVAPAAPPAEAPAAPAAPAK